MASKQKRPMFKRLTRFLEFLIGIFGALAIIGVFFKIQKWPNYEIYMIVGFMGEAAAFVIMGVFSLMEGFTADDREGAAPAAEGGTGAPQRSLSSERAPVRTCRQQWIRSARKFATSGRKCGR